MAEILRAFEDLQELNDSRVLAVDFHVITPDGCGLTLKVQTWHFCDRDDWRNKVLTIRFLDIIKSVLYFGGYAVPPYDFDWATSICDNVFRERWDRLEWDHDAHPVVVGGFGLTSGDHAYLACRRIEVDVAAPAVG